MLNLTRLHLGIAHESQFQGLGIRSHTDASYAETREAAMAAFAKSWRRE
jgi:hypothetical protein